MSNKLIVRQPSSCPKCGQVLGFDDSGLPLICDICEGALGNVNSHSLITAKPNRCSHCGQHLRLNSLGEHVCDICEFVDAKSTSEHGRSKPKSTTCLKCGAILEMDRTGDVASCTLCERIQHQSTSQDELLDDDLTYPHPKSTFYEQTLARLGQNKSLTGIGVLVLLVFTWLLFSQNDNNISMTFDNAVAPLPLFSSDFDSNDDSNSASYENPFGEYEKPGNMIAESGAITEPEPEPKNPFIKDGPRGPNPFARKSSGAEIKTVKDEDSIRRAVGLVVLTTMVRSKDGVRHVRMGPRSISRADYSRLEQEEREFVHETNTGSLFMWDGLSSGTCFLIAADGLGLTNKHVIEGFIEATEEARLYAEIGRMYSSDLTGPLDLSPSILVYFGVKDPLVVTDIKISETYDLAFISIENCNDRPFFALAESGDAKRTEKVWAMGFPGISRRVIEPNPKLEAGEPTTWFSKGQLEYIVTQGEISRVAEDVKFGQMIQHDADTDPGSSGGPLVLENGRVIGINTAGAKQATADGQVLGAGVNLSIGISTIRKEL